MPIGYSSGDVEKAVGFGNLELRERFGLKRKKLRVIKICKARELDEVGWRASAARVEKRVQHLAFRTKEIGRRTKQSIQNEWLVRKREIRRQYEESIQEGSYPMCQMLLINYVGCSLRNGHWILKGW